MRGLLICQLALVAVDARVVNEDLELVGRLALLSLEHELLRRVEVSEQARLRALRNRLPLHVFDEVINGSILADHFH